MSMGDFPGGPVVKNLLCKAVGTDSNLVREIRFHMPRNAARKTKQKRNKSGGYLQIKENIIMEASVGN